MPDPPVFPHRADVVGTAISMTSYAELARLVTTPRNDRATVIAVCNVHSVMSARANSPLRMALDEADVATPDGMPLVWALRKMYGASQERVYGPDLMRHLLRVGSGTRHYLYGSNESTLSKLQVRISEQYPEAEVVGALSPPFRPLTPEEVDDHIDQIRDSGADVVWVGLGMPKQELWMHDVAAGLPGVTLVGVGAAFDFIAGTVRQAPSVLQRLGLEWLFRLVMEPRRLWRRYSSTNPAFAYLMVRQLVSTHVRKPA